MTLYACWIETKAPKCINPTMKATLRSGRKGKGKRLGAVNYWLQSDRSIDDADRIAKRIEGDAIVQGYIILQDRKGQV